MKGFDFFSSICAYCPVCKNLSLYSNCRFSTRADLLDENDVKSQLRVFLTQRAYFLKMLLFLESDIILKVSKVEFIEKVVIVNKIRKNIVIAFFHFESTYMFHRM